MKTLVIIRHAHRDKSVGKKADNGLSAKGRKQARALASFYSEILGPSKPLIYSSPKLRCVETVELIAHQQKAPVNILDCLNESATESEIQERLREFNALWPSRSSPLVVVCSHGDWIPAFIRTIFGLEIDLDKGGWIQIEMENNRPTLRWIVQNLDFL